jgi:hypothetical protein
MSSSGRLQRVIAVSRVEHGDFPNDPHEPVVTHLGFFSNERIACEHIKTYCLNEGTLHLEDLEDDDLKADDSIKIHELKLKNFRGRSPKVGYAIAHMSNGYCGFMDPGPDIPPRLAFIGNCCYGSRSEAKVALKDYKKMGRWKMGEPQGWVSRRFNQGMDYDEDFTHFFEIIKFNLDRGQDWNFDGEEEMEEVDDEEIELYMCEFAAQDADWDNGDNDYADDDWFSDEEDSDAEDDW